ncbi:MAG: hypothetical protein ACM3JI_00625 [Anaerolineae bacterium]
MSIDLPSNAENAKRALREKISRAYSSIQRVVFSQKLKTIIVKNPDPFNRYSQTLELFFSQCLKEDKDDSDFESDLSDSSSDTDLFPNLKPNAEINLFKTSHYLSRKPEVKRILETLSKNINDVDLRKILKTFNLDVLAGALTRGVRVRPKDLLFFFKFTLCLIKKNVYLDEKIEKTQERCNFLKQSFEKFIKNDQTLGKVSKRLQKKEKTQKNLEENREKLKKLIKKKSALFSPSQEDFKKNLRDMTLLLLQAGVPLSAEYGEEDEAVKSEEIGEKTLKNAIKICCELKDTALLTLLIKEGAELTPTVVDAALKLKNDEIIRLMIEKGGKPTFKGLNKLAKKGRFDLLEEFLQLGIKPGLGFFKYILRSGNLEKVMEYDKKLNRNRGGATINDAIGSKKKKVVRWALEAKLPFKDSSLTKAIKTHQTKIIELLLDAKAPVDEDTFSVAVKFGDLAILRRVIGRGAKPPMDDEHRDSDWLFYKMIKKVKKGDLNIEMLRVAVAAGLKVHRGGESDSFNLAVKDALKSRDQQLLFLAIEAGAMPDKETLSLLEGYEDPALMKLIKVELAKQSRIRRVQSAIADAYTHLESSCRTQ